MKTDYLINEKITKKIYNDWLDFANAEIKEWQKFKKDLTKNYKNEKHYHRRSR